MPSFAQTISMISSQAPESLPVYSRRDPDTISIRSSAPSYVSEAPTYHSSVPPRPTATRRHHTRPAPSNGLPPPTAAPGFHRDLSVGEITTHNYNVKDWSPVANAPQARHYKNVAQRRATVALVEEEARLSALARNINLLSPPTTPAESNTPPMSTNRSQTPVEEDPMPISPHEDPDLVGVVAAKAAREKRLFFKRCASEREALKQESKSWDFMLSQMADWNERERSWEKFRNEVGRSKILGRRLG